MEGKRWAASLLWLFVVAPAQAEDAGKRDFPATLVVDEPQVETELSPQIAGNARRQDNGAELSLKLTSSLSLIMRSDYTMLPRADGFQAFEMGAKYEFVADAAHEIVFSAGLSSTLGGTGSLPVGAATTTSLIPTVYFGKGAGDLPESIAWARPFAITGQVGLSVPTQTRSPDGSGQPTSNFTSVAMSGSLQYSFAYASAYVLDNALPKPLSGLIPLVEYEIDVPVDAARASPVGTLDPGFLWVDNDHGITWGLEALIPIKRAAGDHLGARLQLSYSFVAPWQRDD